MIDVSDNIINNCNSDSVIYREYIIIDEQKVIIKAKLSDDIYNNGNFIGTFIMKKLEFETQNDIDYKKKELVYYREVEGESFKIGTFIVTEVNDSDTNEDVKVTAYDYTIKFANTYETELDYTSNKITLGQVLKEVCSKVGIHLANKNFANDNFIVDSNQFDENTQYGNVVQAIAQMSGSFAKINENDELELRLYNVKEEQIEGNNIFIDNASSKENGILEIEGNHYQEVQEGTDNLAVLNEGSITQNGITVDIKDGVASFSGVNTSDTTIYIKVGTAYLYAGQTYYMKAERNQTSGSSGLSIKFGSLIKWLTVGQEIAFECTQTGEYEVRVSFGVSTVQNKGTFRLLISKTSGAKWVQGKKTIPSLEYPSAIETVKDNIKIIQCNSNFLKKQDITEVSGNGITGKILEDGSIVLNGTTQYATYVQIAGDLQIGRYATGQNFKKYVLQKGSYKFNCQVSGQASDNNLSAHIRNSVGPSDFSQVLNRLPENSFKEIEFTTDKEEYVAYLWINSGITLTDFTLKFMLKRADDNSEYIQNEQKEYNLAVQQEMLEGDYFDLENNKEIHNYEKKNMSNLEWQISTNQLQEKTFDFVVMFSNKELLSTDINCFSNCFESKTGSYLWNNDEEGIGQSKSQIVCRVGKEKVADIEEFKTLLAEKNAVVYAKKKTKLDLTEEQKQELNKLQNLELFKGTNNIYTEQGLALLKLTYYSETVDIIEDFEELDDKRDTRPITAVSLGMSDIEGENVVLKWQEGIAKYGENWLIINDNPFAYTQEKRTQLIQAIFDKVKGFGYSSFEAKNTFKPYSQCGDLVKLRNKEGKLIDSIILRINTEHENITLSAPSVIDATVEYQQPLDAIELSKRTEYIVDKQNQTITSLVTKTDELNTQVTKVEQRVDGITQTVEQVQTNLDENYSTTEETNSMIDQKADSITTSVNKTIDNIQIGGTNLIPNSGPYNLDNWLINNTSIIELTLADEETAPFNKALRIRTLSQPTVFAGIRIVPTSKVLEENKEYCFSIWLKSTATTKVTVGYEMGGKDVFTVTTEWQKFQYKFTATKPQTVEHRFVIYLPAGTVPGRSVYAHSIKLEEGNKNTAWSPAPDDTATKVEMNSAITQTAKEINLEVSKKVGNDEVISKINQSAEQVQINANKISLERKRN